jgi:Protein of unknown function (DUF4239)
MGGILSAGRRAVVTAPSTAMRILTSVAIIVGVCIVAVPLMLFVRGRTHAGGLFRDPQLVAGVFNVVGTTYAVLLAFTFLLAFQSFQNAREDGELESIGTTDLFNLAAPFPEPERGALQGELVCYARAVINQEWETMRKGEPALPVQRRIVGIHRAYNRVRVGEDPKAAASYSNWYFAANQREEGRRGRLAESVPIVPPFLWFVLILGALVLGVFVLFLADIRERRRSQAWLMVGMVTIITAGLLSVRFFDHPYEGLPGSIEPTAMQSSLTYMSIEAPGATAQAPCDDDGRATRPGRA